MENTPINYVKLDLSGISCPTNFVKARLKLEDMTQGEILELIVDQGGSVRNVPRALEMDGHEILGIEPCAHQFKVVVKKRD